MQETSKHDPISKTQSICSFPALDVFPSECNVRAEILNVFDVLDIYSIEVNIEKGILHVIGLVFVVLMRGPISLAVRQSKSSCLWAFSKDSSNSTMSTAKPMSLLFSAECRCGYRGTIMKPRSSLSHCEVPSPIQ